MQRNDEEFLSEFFARNFQDVVLPVLETLNLKIEENTKAIEEIRETLDNHTVSLMRLDTIEQLLRDLLSEFKDQKKVFNNHEERIVALEQHI